jgi:chemotaxis-related protein WspB
MLFLLFQLGKDGYALDAAQVVEILPFLNLTPIPKSPRGVAGIFNYRGTPVPAIDLSDLALGRPASMRLGTRIILVRYAPEDGGGHLLGLIAEKVTETLRREPEDFISSGVTNEATPWLGSVTVDARGLIQRVDVNSLLPSSVRDLLFKQPVKT